MEASALRAGRALGPPRLVLRAAGDERLIARIRAGDDRAFEILFERYERPLLSFCRHMLGRREEAEDAVQQAFMSAFAALRRSERDINVRPWLFTIARNQCLSMLRARRDSVPLEDAEPAFECLSA
ncbi:MAG: RNA polymerase sigma factor [Solirubrobacteraceae bacterium]